MQKNVRRRVNVTYGDDALVCLIYYLAEGGGFVIFAASSKRDSSVESVLLVTMRHEDQ